eukprot:m.459582 g.459582  ORF g.459582 m.459582 type:complete len:841 (+) comp21787_c0_seq1:98-2620(+)
MRIPTEASAMAALAALLFGILGLGYGGVYTFAVAVAAALSAAVTVMLLGTGTKELLWPLSAFLFEQVVYHRYVGYDTTMLSDLESFRKSSVRQVACKTANALVQEYVSSWYVEYSKDPEPPQAMRQVLEHAIDESFVRIAAVDRHSFAQDVLVVLRQHVSNVQIARHATGGSGVLDFGPSEDDFIAYYENIPGASHEVGNSKELETKYLCEVAEAITKAIFPTKDTKNALQFHLLARSLLSCVVVPFLDSLVDPDYLYQTVVFVLDDNPTNDPAEVGHGEDYSGDFSSASEDEDGDDALFEAVDAEDRINSGGASDASIGSPSPEALLRRVSSSESSLRSRDGASSTASGRKSPGSSGILDEGYIEKGPSSGIAGTANKNWKERYMKITRSAIVLYKEENVGSILGEIKLKVWPRVFPVDEVGDGRIFCVATRTESHYFRAETIEDRERWLKTFDLIYQLRSRDDTDLTSRNIRPGITLPKYTVTVTRYQRMLHHAEYCLLIRRVRGGATTSATSWEISRRFREFHRLHKLLLSKSKFTAKMKGIQLPERTMTFSQGELTAAKLESRRCALDNYLQALCADWDLGTSYELCQFLSNNSELFPNTRASERKGVVSKVTRVATTFKGKVSEFAESTLKAHQLRKGAMAPQELVFVRRGRDEGSELDAKNPFRDYLRRMPPVIGPVVVDRGSSDGSNLGRGEYAELMLRLGFEVIGYGDVQVTQPSLNRLLNNVMGGVLERFGRAEIDSYLTEEAWVAYANSVSKSIWADEPPPRTAEDMMATKSQAFAALKMCVPDMYFFDQSTVDGGLLCFLACFRSPRLNRHFFLKLLDVCLKHFLPHSD